MKYYYILFLSTNGQETCYPVLIAAENKKELIRRGYRRKFVVGAERFLDYIEAQSRLTELMKYSRF